MSVSLMPFQSLIGEIPKAPLDNNVSWEFGNDLSEKGGDYFNPLVKKHLALQLSYSVMATQLVHSVHALEKGSYQDDEHEQKMLTEKLINTLAMSILLAHIYCYYLNVPREVARLKNEQEIYRQLLAQRGFRFDHYDDYFVKPSLSFSQKIQTYTGDLNWPRLFAVRIRRIFNTLIPVLSQFAAYGRFIGKIDKYVGPSLNHFGWVFYIPRLFTNIFLLLKHTIPGPWMKPKERDELNWLVRIIAQLQRRWFFLGNDSAWFVGNLLGCFLLIGGLAPAGMYVSVGIFFFDVVMASLRAFIELSRIKELQNEYTEKRNVEGISPEERQFIDDYLLHLHNRSIYEQKRLFLSIASTSLLFLAMCLALPPLAFNPIIPLVGAILVVTITLAAYLAGKWLEKQRPCDRVDQKLGKSAWSFFSGAKAGSPQACSKQQSAQNLRNSENAVQLEKNDNPGGYLNGCT